MNVTLLRGTDDKEPKKGMKEFFKANARWIAIGIGGIFLLVFLYFAFWHKPKGKGKSRRTSGLSGTRSRRRTGTRKRRRKKKVAGTPPNPLPPGAVVMLGSLPAGGDSGMNNNKYAYCYNPERVRSNCKPTRKKGWKGSDKTKRKTGK